VCNSDRLLPDFRHCVLQVSSLGNDGVRAASEHEPYYRDENQDDNPEARLHVLHIFLPYT